MGPHRLVALAIACCPAFEPRGPAVQDPPGLRERIQRLAVSGEEAARLEIEALAAAGEVAATAALEDFESASLTARRRRAWLAFRAGGEACIGAAIAALSDPDAETRGLLIALLSRADLGRTLLEPRLAALERVALGDADADLRDRALAALSDLDQPEALDRLDGLIERLASPWRERAAAHLARQPRARDLVLRRARGVLPGPAGAGALAPLLLVYARALADGFPGETAGAAEVAPLLSSLRHPDPRARVGAEIALDGLFQRILARGDAERGDRLLSLLQDEGLDAREALYSRTRLALLLAADPAPAIENARELGRRAAASFGPGDGGREARTWLATAAHLQAASWMAAGKQAEADRALAEEERVLEGLLAERVDREARATAGMHERWLHQRALCELFRIVGALSNDSGAALRGEGLAASTADPSLLERARTIHALELEAQLAAVRGRLLPASSLDALLGSDLSPNALLFANPRLKTWPANRALAVREVLGRLLRTAAPAEVPGFQPFADVPPRVADPLQDPARRALLKRIHEARFDATSVELAELRERLLRRDPGAPILPEPAEMRLIEELEMRWLELLEAGQKSSQGDSAVLLEARTPSLAALALARALRDEGRAVEARAKALALRTDLEASGDLKRYLFFEAEIELLVGSTWTDADEPSRAEVEILRAAERLEAIEERMRERGADAAQIAAVRGLRASALVSLAVNANVKLGDREKALTYFESAWKLRQDDFMRVLLACYRARSGRGQEARAALREVTPTPATLYNLACTYALLGETERALDMLRRDLEENPMTAGAREKQRQWARRDPDLGSLRGDPRFVELVGP